jgi:hypothetical protein
MTDHRREPDFAYDTEPGSWATEDDVPTEVDPQTEQEREEESRKGALFFENFLRSLDLKHLRERRQRELVRDRHSNARDFVAYTSPATAPPRAASCDGAPRAKVLLEPGTGDRTAPTVVLEPIRPSRRRPLGAVVMVAGVVGVWLFARSRSVPPEPNTISVPTANLPASAATAQTLAAVRPVLPAEHATERSAEPTAAMMRSDRPWQKKSDRAPLAPLHTATPTEALAASSTPRGSDPIGERIVSW